MALDYGPCFTTSLLPPACLLPPGCLPHPGAPVSSQPLSNNYRAVNIHGKLTKLIRRYYRAPLGALLAACKWPPPWRPIFCWLTPLIRKITALGPFEPNHSNLLEALPEAFNSWDGCYLKILFDYLMCCLLTRNRACPLAFMLSPRCWS